MANHAHTTTGRPLPPPDIVDLDAHPDGALLRVCAGLVRMRDAQDRLENAIDRAEAELRRTLAVSEDGRRLRELAL